VAEALAYAHKQNVVHRDIKPANIMYEFDSDTVKVTDFGIARITDSSKTKTGLVLGTPSFMSPEQIAGKKVDGRSDLYSLGVMLYQMLAGVLPFRGDSMAELMYKIANEEAPDIRITRREVPERLANIIALALSKRPETRYQTGDQFAADLKSVMADLTGAQAGEPRPLPAGVVMRPDEEVNAGSTDKTVAYSASSRSGAAPAYEPTVIGMPAAPAPGYDPTQKKDEGDSAFAKTGVFRKPDAGSGTGGA
jgi:serine/threonine-protein kinase